MPVQQNYSLPSVTPGRPIVDATVWTGADYPDDRSWVFALDSEMRGEIDRCMRVAMARSIDPKEMTAAAFPIKRTAEFLADVYRDVECGPGFALLSGFPVDGYTEEEITLAYCGLCSHLGKITLQNREGEYILEVTDKGKAYDETMRGYHSNAHLDYHTDGTNTVTLLCLQTAAEGGRSMLVSGPAVYNEIQRTRPEFLDVFHRGFHHHRRNQREEHDPAVTPYRTPVFGFFNGLFHLAYAGPSILYCEDEGIEISEHEKAALDYFEEVVQRPGMSVSMELRKGDLQFVNNFLVLHSRTGYRDTPDQTRKLLRLWLDDENSQRIGPGKMDWYLPEQSRFTRIGGLSGLAAE
ncbi:MAG: TauD/TfdA family dioxygenase [Pseudomonadota bacterium]